MKKDTTEASSNFKAKLKIGSEERIGQQHLNKLPFIGKGINMIRERIYCLCLHSEKRREGNVRTFRLLLKHQHHFFL